MAMVDENKKKHIDKIKETILMAQRKGWEENKKKFETPNDVPCLPIVEKDEWLNFYVPKLIERGAIPKSDLEVGCKYLGQCRNADEATWNGENFVYQRYKFGITYEEKINHFEDDDGFDLFVPIKKY